MNYKKVGEVYSSNDYEIFKKLLGNREVSQNRVKIIQKSIEENGWIRNPIIVNEKFEVIDGQGRLEALANLEMPVEFVISNGATIKDCIKLNAEQINWKITNYIDSYASQKQEEYILLKSLIEKHHNLSPTTVISLCSAHFNSESINKRLVCDGNFVINNKQSIENLLSFSERVISKLPKYYGRERIWCGALKFLYSHKDIQNEELVNRFFKYIEMVNPCVSILQAIEQFEKVYNYGKNNKNKVYPSYDFKKKIGGNQ